jgi:hypothetical protein
VYHFHGQNMFWVALGIFSIVAILCVVSLRGVASSCMAANCGAFKLEEHQTAAAAAAPVGEPDQPEAKSSHKSHKRRVAGLF